MIDMAAIGRRYLDVFEPAVSVGERQLIVIECSLRLTSDGLPGKRHVAFSKPCQWIGFQQKPLRRFLGGWVANMNRAKWTLAQCFDEEVHQRFVGTQKTRLDTVSR